MSEHQYPWCVEARDQLKRLRDETINRFESMDLNDYERQEIDYRALNILRRIPEIPVICDKPDLAADLDLFAREAREGDLLPHHEQCVEQLVKKVQAELDAGATWNGPQMFDRVKHDCGITSEYDEPKITTDVPRLEAEHYEVVGFDSNEEMFDFLSMGRLPKSREELR